MSTERLELRQMSLDDARGLFERRNDPEVARYQGWLLPFPLERAEQMLAEVVAMDGPANDEWWMLAVADPETDDVFGDLAVHLSNQERSAEIGFTLDSVHWGNGYATEAVEALVAYLFETIGVTRVSAKVHPENRSSAMVLERTGFVFEGHTRKSYWVGDEPSDDVIYGMLEPDWVAWRDRPRTPPAEVRLAEVTPDNFWETIALRTHKSQESFVVSVAKSLGQALIPPVDDGRPAIPWFRGIEAEGDIVGFVMVALSDEHRPDPFLWRLLIDRLHQRRGIARRALDLIEAEVRAMGSDAILVSWIEGRGSPRRFYVGCGYQPTGEVVNGETVARKPL